MEPLLVDALAVPLIYIFFNKKEKSVKLLNLNFYYFPTKKTDTNHQKATITFVRTLNGKTIENLILRDGNCLHFNVAVNSFFASVIARMSLFLF